MTSEIISSPQPFISIALPTYNRPEFTRLALKSCLEQDYPHFEVVISDDSKDDQIRRIVESFGSEKVRYIKNDPPLGIPAKLNDLLEKVKGLWMVILGDDDLFEPGYLSTVAALIQQHPDAALMHTRCRQIDENEKLIKIDELQKKEQSPADFLTTVFRPWYEMRVSITGFLFPVAALKRLGGFIDSYMGYYIDNVAWAMLGAQGKSYFEAAPLITLRENPTSISRDFVPDHKRLLSSRANIMKIIFLLFEELSAKTSAPVEIKKIEVGLAQFKECILGDTEDFLDRIFIQTLKKDGRSALSEIREIFRAVKSSEMRLFSKRLFYLRALYYLMISPWPKPFRIGALGLYRLSRRVRISLTGPRTLSEKAHYYRTHTPPKTF